MRSLLGVMVLLLCGCGYARHEPWNVALPEMERDLEVTGFSLVSDPGYLVVRLRHREGRELGTIQTKTGGKILGMSVFAPPDLQESWVFVQVQYGHDVVLRVRKDRVAQSSSEELRRAMGDLYLRVCRWEVCTCADGQRLDLQIPDCVRKKSPAIVAPWRFQFVNGPLLTDK